MTDLELAKNLFALRDTWRHMDENKPLKVYPKPMVALIDALEREIERDGAEELKKDLDINKSF